MSLRKDSVWLSQDVSFILTVTCDCSVLCLYCPKWTCIGTNAYSTACLPIPLFWYIIHLHSKHKRNFVFAFNYPTIMHLFLVGLLAITFVLVLMLVQICSISNIKVWFRTFYMYICRPTYCKTNWKVKTTHCVSNITLVIILILLWIILRFAKIQATVKNWLG